MTDIVVKSILRSRIQSCKHTTGMSRYCAGIEICSWGKRDEQPGDRYTAGVANQQAGFYQPYTPQQEQSLTRLIEWLKFECPEFDIEWVLGHDEVSPGRKNDPGASLSMTMPAYRKHLKAEL